MKTLIVLKSEDSLSLNEWNAQCDARESVTFPFLFAACYLLFFSLNRYV